MQNISKCAFSVTVLTKIKSSETVDTFHKKPKTYLFEIAFLPYIFGGSMLQWQVLPVPIIIWLSKLICLLRLRA